MDASDVEGGNFRGKDVHAKFHELIRLAGFGALFLFLEYFLLHVDFGFGLDNVDEDELDESESEVEESLSEPASFSDADVSARLFNGIFWFHKGVT